MYDELETIVIDPGSFQTRIGIAGDDAPREVNHSVYNHCLKGDLTEQPLDIAEYNFMEEIHSSKRSSYEWRPLIDKKVVTNWPAFQEVIRKSQLWSEPPKGVLMNISSYVPSAMKEEIVAMLFEDMKVPFMQAASSQLMILYSSGRTTGLAVDFGYEVTEISARFDNNRVPGLDALVQFGGKMIEQAVAEHVEGQLNGIPDDLKAVLISDIAQKMCYITSNETILTSKLYELPDGQMIELSPTTIESPGRFFNGDDQSQFGGQGIPGKIIQHEINSIIERASTDHKRDFAGNIILAGGTSVTNGLDELLKTEIPQALTNSTLKCKVIAPPERKYSCWIGGSIFASLTTFREAFMITKETYEENGAYHAVKKLAD